MCPHLFHLCTTKKIDEFVDAYEVGWHLRKAAWGNGYATEIGKALLDYGFNVLNLPVLYAAIAPGNVASVRVAQKLGMAHLDQTVRYYDDGDELYRISANIILVL